MPPTIDKGSNMVLVLRELKRRPLCVHDCSALLRIARRNAIRYLKHLHAEGKVHISAWRKANSGPATPVYSIGAGTDAARPAARSGAERKRDRMKRKRAIRILAKSDPLLSMFFRKERRRRKKPASE